MLEIKNLSVCRGKRTVLDDVTLTVTPHKLTALIGKNGCGKSTLISCINQTAPYTGEISFSGRNLALMRPKERACLLSFLPQTLFIPHVTVSELVTMGRSPYVDIGKHLTPRDREAVRDAIFAVKMEAFSNRYLDELSGGERQKAYLAMTLAQDTRVMILDEPTTYMDMAYEHAFLDLLDSMKRHRKKTLLVVMHNLNQAVRYADRLIVLDGGKIVFDGETSDCIQSGVIERVFGVRRYTGEERTFFSAE